VHLDIAIAKLIEADHSNNINEKNDLLNTLKKYQYKSTILQTFIVLDNIINENKFHCIDDYLKENTLENLPILVEQLTQNLSSYNSDDGLNINSVYLIDNGKITAQLPSHYKFDRAILSMLNINSTSLDKDNLIVPVFSNTIRIFYNIAVIRYQPTTEQINTLLEMNISKFMVNDCYYDNIFDENILRLKTFRT
jgi:hypothetical protein